MFKGLLVIGRDTFLDNPLHLKKINHRARLMSTYEASFQIVTYDQLCLELVDNFNYMPSP